MERENAGARIVLVEGWEQLFKTTASKVIGKKLVLCNRAVKWCMREAHAKYTSSETTAGWEEYAIARKKVKYMVCREGNTERRS